MRSSKGALSVLIIVKGKFKRLSCCTEINSISVNNTNFLTHEITHVYYEHHKKNTVWVKCIIVNIQVRGTYNDIFTVRYVTVYLLLFNDTLLCRMTGCTEQRTGRESVQSSPRLI